MFRGDILNFSPADLLIFLAHLGKEGELTVRSGAEALGFSFRRGCLVDAQSESVDRLLLRMLRHRAETPERTLAYIEQAKRETGLPLRQILENLEWLCVPGHEEVLGAGLREAVFRLFLLERGEFQFAELPVEAIPGLAPLDCRQLAMDTARRVDEYRESLRRLGPSSRAPLATAAGRQAGGDPAVRLLLDGADGRRPLRELLEEAPLPAAEAAAALDRALTEGWIEFPAGAGDEPPAPRELREDAFPTYRRALRQMLRAAEPQAKLQVLLGFCRERFDRTLLLAVRRGRVAGGRLWTRDTGHGPQPGSRLPAGAGLDLDPIFQRVAASRLAFCGGAFESRLLDALGIEPSAGDCALVAVGELEGSELLVYAATTATAGSLPHLELLAWHLQAPEAEAPAPPRDPEPGRAASAPGTALPATAGAAAAPAPAGRVEPGAADPLQRLVASVGELPSMPHVMSRALELLADPECRLPALAATLSLDPALVGRLVKVANSALYSGGRKAGSLNQALVRLGLRTTRSLVVAVSARSLFPTDSARVGPWGQALWQHSVQCGLAARRVAQASGGTDPDEAFVAGVLHDIGKVLILLHRPEAYRSALRLQEGGNLDSCAAEMRLLGFDHAEAGARLLQHWGMPEGLVEAVRRHHAPAGDPLARLVAAADELSHAAEVALAVGADGGQEAAGPSPRAESLGFSPGRLAELRATVANDIAGCDLLD